MHFTYRVFFFCTETVVAIKKKIVSETGKGGGKTLIYLSRAPLETPTEQLDFSTKSQIQVGGAIFKWVGLAPTRLPMD